MFYEEDKGFDVEYQRIFPVKNSTANTRFFIFFTKSITANFLQKNFSKWIWELSNIYKNLICGLHKNIFYL